LKFGHLVQNPSFDSLTLVDSFVSLRRVGAYNPASAPKVHIDSADGSKATRQNVAALLLADTWSVGRSNRKGKGAV